MGDGPRQWYYHLTSALMTTQRITLTPEQKALAIGLDRNLREATANAETARAMARSAEQTERAARIGLSALCASIANDFTGRASYDPKSGDIVIAEARTPKSGGDDANL